MSRKPKEEEDWTIRPMTREEYYDSRGNEILERGRKFVEREKERAGQPQKPLTHEEIVQITKNLKELNKKNEERERMFKLAEIMKPSGKEKPLSK